MKLSLMTFSMLFDGVKKIHDADLLCRIVKESGLDEVDMMQMEFRIYDREALLAAMKKYEVRCGCLIISAPFFTAPENVEAVVRDALTLALEAGASCLMIVPGDRGKEDKAACERLGRLGILDLAAKHFAMAVEIAAEYGIQIAFENTPHDYKPLSSAEDCKYLLDRVPGLGMVFDTANFRVADKESDEISAYALLKDRIVRFHLKDVRIGEFVDGEPCVGGGAIKAVLTGSGVIPVEGLLHQSMQDGFSGTYAVEYMATSDTHGIGHKEVVSTYVQVIERMAALNHIHCPQKDFYGLDKPVSEIFFGTAIMPMQLDANARYLLDLAIALGINAFDCARGYGNAETVLGKWMKERGNREEVVILTKCGNVDANGSVCVNGSVIRRELDESLERLQTGYIDIYLLHRDDPGTPIGEIMEVLNEAKQDGKIRVFGVSNWTHERIQEANDYAQKHGLDGFCVSSPNYGLARQITDPWGGGCVTISGPKNEDARGWYSQNQMPVLAYSSLGRGFFSGKFKSYDYDGAKRVLDGVAQKGYLSEDNMERLKRVEELASKNGLSVAQTAMQFVLGSPMNVFAIVSMTKAERIFDNVQAACVRIGQEEWETLNQ